MKKFEQFINENIDLEKIGVSDSGNVVYFTGQKTGILLKKVSDDIHLKEGDSYDDWNSARFDFLSDLVRKVV